MISFISSARGRIIGSGVGNKPPPATPVNSRKPRTKIDKGGGGGGGRGLVSLKKLCCRIGGGLETNAWFVSVMRPVTINFVQNRRVSQCPVI